MHQNRESFVPLHSKQLFLRYNSLGIPIYLIGYKGFHCDNPSRFIVTMRLTEPHGDTFNVANLGWKAAHSVEVCGFCQVFGVEKGCVYTYPYLYLNERQTFDRPVLYSQACRHTGRILRLLVLSGLWGYPSHWAVALPLVRYHHVSACLACMKCGV